jgi:hypothetical protein
MKLLASLVLLFAAFTARAAEWDHYQVILDRHPFGSLTGANTNVTPDFAKSLRLSAIWMTHGQPRAGFEDSGDKIKRDFVLGRGEISEDGVELVDVNVADEAAIIRKGNENATLHIQSGASTNMPVVGAPGMPPGAGNPGNPWREFYERYRQRHQQDGGGGPTPPFPMPGAQGGPGGPAFGGGNTPFTITGGGAGQAPAVIMQSAGDANQGGRGGAQMMNNNSGDGSSGAPRSRRNRVRSSDQ